MKPNPTYGRGTVYGQPIGIMLPKGSQDTNGQKAEVAFVRSTEKNPATNNDEYD